MSFPSKWFWRPHDLKREDITRLTCPKLRGCCCCCCCPVTFCCRDRGGADVKRGTEEGALCCPTRLQRPLDRDQDSETVKGRGQESVGQRGVRSKNRRQVDTTCKTERWDAKPDFHTLRTTSKHAYQRKNTEYDMLKCISWEIHIQFGWNQTVCGLGEAALTRRM